MSDILQAATRKEKILAAIATGNLDNMPEGITRVEKILQYMAKNGLSGVTEEEIDAAVSAYMTENPVSAEVADGSISASKLGSDIYMTDYTYVEGTTVAGDVKATGTSAVSGYNYREILLNIPTTGMTLPYTVNISWDDIETNGTQGNTNTAYGYTMVSLMNYLSSNELTNSTSLVGLTKYTLASFVSTSWKNVSATKEISTASAFLKIGIRVAIWEDDTDYIIKNLNIKVGGKTISDISSMGMFADATATVTSTVAEIESSPLILRKTDLDFINNMSRFYGKKCLWFGDSISASSSFLKTVDFVSSKMGIDITNVAVAGTGYALDGFGTAWYKRVTETYSSEYDLVVIMGGGNDALNSDAVALGEYGNTELTITEGETTKANFYAVLESMYSQIRNSYPLKDVLIITPLPMWSSSDTALVARMPDFVKAIKLMAEKYNLPLLDLYRESYYNVDVETFRTQYTVTADGIHPVESYHEEKITPKVISKLKSI